MSTRYHAVDLYPQLVPHHRGPCPRLFFSAGFLDNVGNIREQECLLDTGTTITVMPRLVRNNLNLQVTKLSGWRRQPVPSWRGWECRICRVTMVLGGVELPLLTRIPKKEQAWQYAEWAPGSPIPVVSVGTEFLLHFRIRVELSGEDMRPEAPCGKLLLPLN